MSGFGPLGRLPLGESRQIEATGGAYTLTAASGSFALTGTVATLKFGRALTATSSSYALTGAANAFGHGYYVAAASGSFALSGVATALPVTRKLTAATASFALSGTAASLQRGYRLTSASASFSIAGTAASLERGFSLTAGPGSFAATGSDVTFTRPLRVECASGAFALTGSDVALSRTRAIVAAVRAYELSGANATLGRGSTLTADAAAFGLTGSSATLKAQRGIEAASASYTLTRPSALLDAGVKYVNGIDFNTTNQTLGSSPRTLDISSLSIAEGDVLVVSVLANTGSSGGWTSASGNNSGAATKLGQASVSGSRPASLAAFYLIQGATPDTQISLVHAYGPSLRWMARVEQYRGADIVSLVDVASVTATGTGSDDADAASITPNSAKVFAICGATSSSTAWTAPANMTLLRQATCSTGFIYDLRLGTAEKDGVSGAFDPDPVTGGSASTSNVWAAITVALRSLTDPLRLSASSGAFVSYDGFAAFAKGFKLVAASTSFSLGYTAAGLAYARKIMGGAGSYALTGASVTLTNQPRITADAGSYALTGPNTGLFKGKTLNAASGAYSLTGTDFNVVFGQLELIEANAARFALGRGTALMNIDKAYLRNRRQRNGGFLDYDIWRDEIGR